MKTPHEMQPQPPRIINTYDQQVAGARAGIKNGGTVIHFTPDSSRERGGTSASYSVSRRILHEGKFVEVKTDPNAHWRDHGHKTFNIWGRADKPAKLAEAQKWCLEQYGIPLDAWARNRWGSYVLAEVNKRFPIPPRPRATKEQKP